jgi:hypothetical protein
LVGINGSDRAPNLLSKPSERPVAANDQEIGGRERASGEIDFRPGA